MFPYLLSNLFDLILFGWNFVVSVGTNPVKYISNPKEEFIIVTEAGLASDSLLGSACTE